MTDRLQIVDSKYGLCVKDAATNKTELMDQGINGMLRSGILDAANGIAMHRSLEFHKSYVYKHLYAKLRAKELFPMVTEGQYGIEFLTHKIMDTVGEAQMVGDYGAEIPKADANLREAMLTTADISCGWEYNVKELAAASIHGAPIGTYKAEAAAMAYAEKLNRIIFFGERNIGGFFDNADIPVQAAATGAGGNTTFASKTPQEIYEDFVTLVSQPWEQSKMIEAPTHVLMSPAAYRLIHTTNWDSTNASNITIADYIKKNLGQAYGAKAIQLEALNECAASNNPLYGSDILVAYTKENSKLEFVTVKELAFEPVQRNNLAFEVNGFGSVAGFRVTFPRSALIMTGV